MKAPAPKTPTKTKTAKSTKTPKSAEKPTKSKEITPEQKPTILRRLNAVIGYSVLIAASFLVSSFVVVVIARLIFGDELEIVMNTPLFGAALTAAIFSLMLALVILIPRQFLRIKTTLAELGLIGLPTWTDIVLAPVGYIVSSILGALLLFAAASMFNINLDQEQSLPFAADTLVSQMDYILAFIALVIIAPVVEEIIFRGFFYSKLRPHVNMWIAAIVVSIVFGALHGQWNVAIIVGSMSFIMCLIREKLTGTIWAPILIHMVRNGIAFYLLFVNPQLLHMIG
ncbi:CPBP family intramembrane metalloprotease [Candidatus Saccharibacteria bacterium]|nr:CPBP family intramembrane metalloprotease [Candidatus Saccharibacteria bacterium]